MTKIGPNILENISSRPYKTVLDQNNILEDELFGPLISVPNNCLPGCWAREDNKQENFNNNMLVKGPVWNGGGPVQCCGGAYGRGVRPSGLPPPPPILLYMLGYRISILDSLPTFSKCRTPYLQSPNAGIPTYIHQMQESLTTGS